MSPHLVYASGLLCLISSISMMAGAVVARSRTVPGLILWGKVGPFRHALNSHWLAPLLIGALATAVHYFGLELFLQREADSAAWVNQALALTPYVPLAFACLSGLCYIASRVPVARWDDEDTDELPEKFRDLPTIMEVLEARARLSAEVPDWDITNLRRLPHREFEVLCQRLFEAEGLTVGLCDEGRPDGGVDLVISHPGRDGEILGQCKQYPRAKVGVELVRELYGVMAARKAPYGVFITSGEYTSYARDFSRENPRLILIDGPELLQRLHSAGVKMTDEFNPNPPGMIACPLCNSEMDWQERGGFWKCCRSPRCSGRRFKQPE